jgi:hypothetical protein
METQARVFAQVEALMLQPMLEPLEQAFGEYGAIAVSEFSQALATALQR